MSRLVILGPQRFQPTVVGALQDLGCHGPVAVITAGWQEREAEVDELAAHVDRELINLRLYGRAERVFAEDPELGAAVRQRQDELKRLQELYRLRLAHALDAARELQRRRLGTPLGEEHRRAAIRAVRALDRQHLRLVRRHHEAFEQRWRPVERPAVARQAQAIAERLERASALAVAGGHVAVLLNRIRLFGLQHMVGKLPVVAWSAGAMALAERVVLFHDYPPQGPGNAEVFEAGVGLARGIVPLPHASRRLRLADPLRVALLARRFAPAACVRLDSGARLDWDGARWTPAPGTERLTSRGSLVELGTQ